MIQLFTYLISFEVGAFWIHMEFSAFLLLLVALSWKSFSEILYSILNLCLIVFCFVHILKISYLNYKTTLSSSLISDSLIPCFFLVKDKNIYVVFYCHITVYYFAGYSRYSLKIRIRTTLYISILILFDKTSYNNR